MVLCTLVVPLREVSRALELGGMCSNAKQWKHSSLSTTTVVCIIPGSSLLGCIKKLSFFG